MDTDEADRVTAIARLLIDDGYVDNESDALRAAARILQVARAELGSRNPSGASTTTATSRRAMHPGTTGGRARSPRSFQPGPADR